MADLKMRRQASSELLYVLNSIQRIRRDLGTYRNRLRPKISPLASQQFFSIFISYKISSVGYLRGIIYVIMISIVKVDQIMGNSFTRDRDIAYNVAILYNTTFWYRLIYEPEQHSCWNDGPLSEEDKLLCAEDEELP